MWKLAALLSIITVACDAFPQRQSSFAQDALTAHNTYRATNCVPALTLSDTLTAYAQQRVNNLMALDAGLSHAGLQAGYGENLYASWASDPTAPTAQAAVQEWYNEVTRASYNYVTGSGSGVTGHFTQVVWKGSTQVGCAVAGPSKTGWFFVGCNYTPPGNYNGQFVANVLNPATCRG